MFANRLRLGINCTVNCTVLAWITAAVWRASNSLQLVFKDRYELNALCIVGFVYLCLNNRYKVSCLNLLLSWCRSFLFPSSCKWLMIGRENTSLFSLVFIIFYTWLLRHISLFLWIIRKTVVIVWCPGIKSLGVKCWHYSVHKVKSNGINTNQPSYFDESQMMLNRLFSKKKKICKLSTY